MPSSVISGSNLEPLVCAAAVGHAFQMPAMLVAERALGWDSPDRLPINARIATVLRWTLPAAKAALILLLISNRDAGSAGRLTTALASLVVLLALMSVWRRLGAAAARFARQRREIVLLLVGLGALTLSNVREVMMTSLGAGLCGLLAILYGTRLLIQLFYYAAVWPRQPLLRVAHWALIALFCAQSSIYLLAACSVNGRL